MGETLLFYDFLNKNHFSLLHTQLTLVMADQVAQRGKSVARRDVVAPFVQGADLVMFDRIT